MEKNGRRRSGQMMKSIPVFGDWDAAADLPITQYFESAARAPSSGDLCHRTTIWSGDDKGGHLRFKGATGGGKQPVKAKVCDLPTNTTTRKAAQNHVVGGCQPPCVRSARNRRPTLAVDEDLYKIPPDMLQHTQRKKKLGFISRCLAMPCTA